MKRFFLLLSLSMFMGLPLMAQDEVEATVSADFVNQYIWRGQDLGHVSLQPTLGVAYRGLSLTAWGSVGLSHSDDAKEIDLTLAYSSGGFNVGVTDYWTTDGLDAKGRYFRYEAHETNHLFEVNVGYDFGVASVQWFTNFAGADGVNKSDKRAYSSYVETTVPFRLASLDWTATVGFVPYATDYYDANGFAVTNLSLMANKEVRITDSFGLPLFAGLVANPCAQKAYFVFGFTLQP